MKITSDLRAYNNIKMGSLINTINKLGAKNYSMRNTGKTPNQVELIKDGEIIETFSNRKNLWNHLQKEYKEIETKILNQ